MNYLDKILAYKREEIAHYDKTDLKHRLQDIDLNSSPTNDFCTALKRKSPDHALNLIAELKKASPSRGVLIEDFRPVEIAKSYRALGASAFSILTDERFFQGHAKYLESVRRSFDLPILRKDFIIDDSQIYEARLIGADAILLIVAALEPGELKDFRLLAESLGMQALVEAHSHHELEIALMSDAKIVGVNNRDLKTFQVNIQTSCDLKTYFPDDVISVSESGIKTEDDLHLLSRHGFDAVLIGEGLISDQLKSYPWK